MKKTILFFFCITAFFASAQSKGDTITLNNTSLQMKPTLFASLGETCSTPDGMAIDKSGHLFLAVTNLETFDKYGSKILTFDENNQPTVWYDSLPLHPKTKQVHPMGIEFGDDGHLYIADNQYFAGEKDQSRILRIKVIDGKPQKAEILVEGLGFSNGIRLFGNTLYLTDFLFSNQKESGIYHFQLKDLNKGKIVLDSVAKQQYLLGTFPVGIDGIALDQKGNLYAGHFLNGSITKIEFTKKRKVKSRKIVFQSDQFICADGMFFDKTRNTIFLANLENNGVYKLDLNTNTLQLLWENENNDGSTGLLDNPCETIVYKNKLLVVNFDTFLGSKNLEIDSYKTISVIEL